MKNKVKILGIYSGIELTPKKMARENAKLSKTKTFKDLRTKLRQASKHLEPLESYDIDWDRIEKDIRDIQALYKQLV